MEEYVVTAYKVKGCKISKTEIWNGYVFALNHEDIITAIKRKFGLDHLLCEYTNEGFDYDEVPVYSVALTELTIGEFYLLSGKKMF